MRSCRTIPASGGEGGAGISVAKFYQDTATKKWTGEAPLQLHYRILVTRDGAHVNRGVFAMFPLETLLRKAALQQAKNCSATLKKLRCRKVALSCRFPADFKLPRLGTHV